MAGRGGKRIGSGRKATADELKTQVIAMSALVAKYGSQENAMKAAVESNNPQLVKFVYEHAFGKPQDKIEHSGEVSQNIVGMIIK
jgi:spore coat protein CotF